MADANYTRLGFIEESTYGVTPASANLQLMRITGESLAHTKETVVSNELRSDRQRADLIQVGAMASGGFEFELSQGALQPWMLAALGADAWTTVNVSATATSSVLLQTLVTTAGGFANVPVGGFVKIAGFNVAGNNGLKRVIDKSVDNNTLTLAPGSITAIQVGASLTITGKDARNGIDKKFFTVEREILAPDNAKYFQSYTGCAVDEFNLNVESKAIVTGTVAFMGKRGVPALNSVNTLSGAYAAGQLTAGATDPTPSDTLTVNGRVYTLVASLTAADQIVISGTPATMAENIRDGINGDEDSYNITHTCSTANAYVSATADTDATVEVVSKLIGAVGNAYTTTTTAAGGALAWGAGTLTGGVTPTAAIAAPTDPIMNAVTNVGQIFQGDVVATERFRQIGIAIKNNLRAKDAISELGAFEIGWGTIDITGSLSMYFKNNSFYEALVNHDYSGIAFTLTDANGKSLAFTMPWVSFGTGDPQAKGINTDIMLETEYTAIMHPVLGCSIIVNAFD